MRFTLPPTKNAIDRPSGDQNGKSPLSVPASGRAVIESSGRSQSDGAWPPTVRRNTIALPSGETAVPV